MPPKTIAAQTCQDRLFFLWMSTFLANVLFLAGVLFIRFEGHEKEVCTWFTQTYFPLFGTMIAKWLATNRGKPAEIRYSWYLGAMLVSIVYLILASGFLYHSATLSIPLHPPADVTFADLRGRRVQFLHDSSLVLGFLVLPVSTLLAVCFKKK